MITAGKKAQAAYRKAHKDLIKSVRELVGETNRNGLEYMTTHEWLDDANFPIRQKFEAVDERFLYKLKYYPGDLTPDRIAKTLEKIL